MANLLDYLDWRGDLTLAQAPFNEVDNLILSELSYLDFGGIVPPPGEKGGVPLHQAAEAFFQRYGEAENIDMGVLVPSDIPVMLRRMAVCPRFRDMELHCFADWLDNEQAEQFAALTVDTGDGRLYMAFRGTDDTLAGWKEDLHMACMPQVPAQAMAVQYTRQAAKQLPRRKLRLGGHSKGGNLAVYAAVFCTAAVQRRIERVWSNDGPGFHHDLRELPVHRKVADRIVSIVPSSSVVGMLLEHEEDYEVVESSQRGLWQHDGFSWEVLGDHFVRLGSVDRQSRLYDKALHSWVRQMPMEQRERFVEGLFSVLTASGAQTLTDLKEDHLKSAGAMVRAMKDMDKDTRDALFYAVGLLLRTNAQAALEDWQQEGEKKRNAKKKEKRQ